MLKKVLGEPLFHFLAAGGLIFGLWVLASGDATEIEDNRIVITPK